MSVVARQLLHDAPEQVFQREERVDAAWLVPHPALSPPAEASILAKLEAWRPAIKDDLLPVHDLGGCEQDVCAFGGWVHKISCSP